MAKPEKEYMVKELAGRFSQGRGLFVSNFGGLSSGEMNELRRALEDISSDFMVAKNSISRLALRQTNFGGIIDLVEGTTGFALVGEDSIATSKVLVKFSKGHPALEIRGGFLDGEIILLDQIEELASLPSMEVLVGKAVWGMKMPLVSFVNVLLGSLRSLIYGLNNIREKKEVGNPTGDGKRNG